MTHLMKKAVDGKRPALQQLFDSYKQPVYYFCHALLRSAENAAPATIWALKTALQAIPKCELQTEEDFLVFAIKQAAGYCKIEILKKDPKAFRLPIKKDFRLKDINKDAIVESAGPLENYLNCLPPLHRFVFTLHYVGHMSAENIANCAGLETAAIERALEVQSDNLSRIYRAVIAAGGQYTAPTDELLCVLLADAIHVVMIPSAVEHEITSYIDSVAAPGEKKQKKRMKIAVLITAIMIICLSILASSSSGVGNDPEMDEVQETQASNAQETTVETSVSQTEYTEPFNIAPTEATEKRQVVSYYADIKIEDYGIITVALDAEAAPATVENFVTLAQSGFYDGLTFHRIIEGFMMQGGDPNGDGTGGSEKTIVGEFSANGYNNTLSHTAGAISMARANDYNSASSQFFIVHEDSTYLDGQYAVFGYVTKGMDIVDAICSEAQPTDNNGTIDTDAQPVITSIKIRTEGQTSQP